MIKILQGHRIHHGFMKYFINISWRLGERFLRSVVSLTVIVWVIRYLGPEKFGLISYAQSLVSLFGVLATLGLDMIIIRELVKNNSKRDDKPSSLIQNSSILP